MHLECKRTARTIIKATRVDFPVARWSWNKVSIAHIDNIQFEPCGCGVIALIVRYPLFLSTPGAASFDVKLDFPWLFKDREAPLAATSNFRGTTSDLKAPSRFSHSNQYNILRPIWPNHSELRNAVEFGIAGLQFNFFDIKVHIIEISCAAAIPHHLESPSNHKPSFDTSSAMFIVRREQNSCGYMEMSIVSRHIYSVRRWMCQVVKEGKRRSQRKGRKVPGSL